jgi:hypothetical protein
MKKIIAAFDGLNLSESTIQYAVYLAKRYDAQITGFFLKEYTQVGYAVYATIENFASEKSVFSEINRADHESMKKSIDLFKNICQENEVRFHVQSGMDNYLEDLLYATAFADLLIIDAWETFSYIESGLPSWFIRNVLRDAQCPVLAVPNKFQAIKKIVLLYDGSPSAIHAIKIFSYIFPETNNMHVQLMSTIKEIHEDEIPDAELIREWMNLHFPRATFNIVHGKSHDIPSILSDKNEGVMAVAGSYHRSNLSRFIHKSLADLIIRDASVPLFIAHI